MMHLRIASPCYDRSTIPGLSLMGVWFAGVSLGLWAARFYGDAVEGLALTAAMTDPGVWGLCMAAVFPLFLSAFAVYFFHRAGAYCACLVRGLAVGFLLGCLVAAGGLWLGLLLGFSSLAVNALLLWFLWRRLLLGQICFRRDCIWALLAAVLLAAVEYWAVAPFLARALSF